MEGKTETFDFPALTLPPQEGQHAEFLRLLVVHAVHIVHEIVIEVIHVQFLFLLRENPRHLLLAPEHHVRHLRGNRERIARIAIHNGFAHSFLAHEIMIHPGRIAVGEAPLQELIHHLLHLRHINRFLIICIRQRQAHKAQPKFLCWHLHNYFLHEYIYICFIIPLLPIWIQAISCKIHASHPANISH